MNVEGERSGLHAKPSGVCREGWPSREAWQTFILCAIQVQLVWLVVYCGASWVTAHRSTRFDFSTPLDAKMPFVPAAAIVYLLVMPLMWVAPFVLRTPAAIRQLSRSLQILILLSGVGFLLFPGNDLVAPKTPDGFSGLVFNFADAINLKHNLFPSLHVGMAVVCAYAYQRHLSRGATIAVWTAAAAVAVSTLLTHQHYLADAVAGGAVGWTVARLCYQHAALERPALRAPESTVVASEGLQSEQD